MKKLPLIIAICAALGITAASCADMPLIGRLEGQWQIMNVEYPSGRTVVPDRHYFCFYRHTANLTYYGISWLYGANLDYREEADSLTIDIPTGGIDLAGWGIDRITPQRLDFRILDLTRKRLVMLYEDSVTFTLRKF